MKKLLLALLIIGTAIMIVVMVKTGAPLKTSAKYKSILSLEFAYSEEKTTAVINDWGIANVAAAKTNTCYDFIFLFFYSLLLFFTCDKIAFINKSKMGISIANGAIWAGLLDIIENAGMLMTLSGNGSATVAFVTAFVSIIKWGLVIAAILYALGGIIQLAIKKKIGLLLS